MIAKTACYFSVVLASFEFIAAGAGLLPMQSGGP
jgi:hypothetical protein